VSLAPRLLVPLSKPITVVVVEPHPVVREGLPLLLKDEGLLVVAGASHPEVAEPLIARHDPDVVLLAGGRERDGAADLVRRLVRRGARATVVLYVDGKEADSVQEALRAGAAGVVSTRRPVAQIARALRAAAVGRTWFDEPDWVEAPLTPAAEDSLQRSDGLSGTEKRVLALVAAGASTEDIAGGLGMSPHTVRTHVRNLLRKLDAQSRAHAVAIAMREAAIDMSEASTGHPPSPG
jgi:DNA-binding NarL/FixJ family response regulator